MSRENSTKIAQSSVIIFFYRGYGFENEIINTEIYGIIN